MTSKRTPKRLVFTPLTGLASPHVQTILPAILPVDKPPLSTLMRIPLSDGDSLWGEVSTPPAWEEHNKTVFLIHGMIGNARSHYMVRMSNKLYNAGIRTVRLSLRGTHHSDEHPVQRPYYAGASHDILEAINFFKTEKSPPCVTIGYSFGGNIVLNLAGELGKKAPDLLEMTIAVCTPVDLTHGEEVISNSPIYNFFYTRQIAEHAKPWTKGKTYERFHQYDNEVTAPLWGYKDAFDYYAKCSSVGMFHEIQHPCHLIFSEDDPLVDYSDSLVGLSNPNIHIWLSKFGGHLGFLGWTEDKTSYYWLDELMFSWIHGKRE